MIFNKSFEICHFCLFNGTLHIFHPRSFLIGTFDQGKDVKPIGLKLQLEILCLYVRQNEMMRHLLKNKKGEKENDPRSCHFKNILFH